MWQICSHYRLLQDLLSELNCSESQEMRYEISRSALPSPPLAVTVACSIHKASLLREHYSRVARHANQHCKAPISHNSWLPRFPQNICKLKLCV